ncbi:hypothetical protein L210DRAFT_3475101 [Boletus edulis BED1]|uniref:Signal recognition particle subunit SRP68 n=1 Tax=Boletus edulis BED1 TaxID=1328754 RepID=A0AAD4C2M5_BOLED|nr:hypothetical protein L210DRAFT_3475101 [Boletus edulis BED1]
MSDGKLSFQALQLANEQRSAYGLRYNDFTRYRKHCGNRTHRLRSTLKMTHGKGKDFKKLPPMTTDIIKEGHLQLLLFEAERAWAHSQDLVAQALLPTSVAHAGTLRHSATGRFRRAVHWSTQLLSHCQSLYVSSRLKASSLIQATVYTLVVNGRFLRYRDDFEDAIIQLSVARSLLDELAERAETSRDQALATLFADGIGPEIRYCAHELGREKAYDVDGIVKELAGRHRGNIVEGYDGLIKAFRGERAAGSGQDEKQLETLMWEGQPVPVRNPELVDVLLKVQEAEGKIAVPRDTGDGMVEGKKKGKGLGSKKGVAAFDAVLLALSDAEEVARKLLEAQQNAGTVSAAAGGTRDIQFVHGYIVYQLLSRRIQRDMVLVSTLLGSHTPRTESRSKTKEQVDARLYPAVVKLLDTVVQSLTQMRSLSNVDESPDLAAAIEARLTYTRARRCFFLAQCYVAVKKYGEALTLIQHATLHVRETRSVLATLSGITTPADASYPLGAASVDALDSTLSSVAADMKNDWFAYNGGTLDGDLKTYKKPLFFDIGLNYVQLDMDRLMQRVGKAPPATARDEREAPPGRSRVEEVVVRPETPEPSAPATGGLGSLLGGWWGRR